MLFGQEDTSAADTSERSRPTRPTGAMASPMVTWPQSIDPTTQGAHAVRIQHETWRDGRLHPDDTLWRDVVSSRQTNLHGTATGYPFANRNRGSINGMVQAIDMMGTVDDNTVWCRPRNADPQKDLPYRACMTLAPGESRSGQA